MKGTINLYVFKVKDEKRSELFVLSITIYTNNSERSLVIHKLHLYRLPLPYHPPKPHKD